jgi:hypothetical protein
VSDERSGCTHTDRPAKATLEGPTCLSADRVGQLFHSIHLNECSRHSRRSDIHRQRSYEMLWSASWPATSRSRHALVASSRDQHLSSDGVCPPTHTGHRVALA